MNLLNKILLEEENKKIHLHPLRSDVHILYLKWIE